MKQKAERIEQIYRCIIFFRSGHLNLCQAVSKIVGNDQEQGKGRHKSEVPPTRRDEQCILRRLLTQLLNVRCIFEIAWRKLMPLSRYGLFCFGSLES